MAKRSVPVGPMMGPAAMQGCGCSPRCRRSHTPSARLRGQQRARERRAWVADWRADRADAEAERYAHETLRGMLPGGLYEVHAPDLLWA